ncbi:MAG: HAD family hydrolase [Propionibacteriales bacterium]|nr:HAD family hydrolase [Propionibacteriales bacterium]
MLTTPIRLAVWSGPRNISTALMRAWENRADSLVLDEPLYAHFLAVTGIDHPGRDEVLAVGETDWHRVVDGLLAPVPGDIGVCYHKQMAHHLTSDMGREWIGSLTNVLLIRDPCEVVASYIKSRATVTADDIGLPQQVRLYDELSAGGEPPPVIDAAAFLQDPETFLRAMCEWVGLPFTDDMLSWRAGPRDSDGVWAPYWYAAVQRSTGFEPYRHREVHLNKEAAAVAAECLPYYERLHAVRWTP